MSRLSRQDLKTILLCGIHLAKVDSDFSLQEKKLLRRFSEAMNLADGERAELLAMGGSIAENLEQLTSDYARELLLKTLCAVSFVDGVTDAEEIAFIEKVRGAVAADFPLPPPEEWSGFEEEVFSIVESHD